MKEPAKRCSIISVRKRLRRVKVPCSLGTEKDEEVQDGVEVLMR